MEKEQEVEDVSMIRVEKLSKAFGSLQVLKDVDLTVEKGERIVIIGGSGCGKSVFLSVWIFWKYRTREPYSSDMMN